MNRTDAVKAVIWLDQLALQAKAEAGKLRSELLADARAEFEEQGTAPTWRIPDLATVAASVSHRSVYVADEPALLEWVKQRHPDNVEIRVRPAFVTWLLAAATVEDDVVFLEDGEIVPGLGVHAGGEFAGLSIRATSAAKEVFSALASHGLRELVANASPAVPVLLAELSNG